jgi:hypothetical protein
MKAQTKQVDVAPKALKLIAKETLGSTPILLIP